MSKGLEPILIEASWLWEDNKAPSPPRFMVDASLMLFPYQKRNSLSIS